ncbi:hypothetical protein [Streptomyces sp. NBC_00572]|uniref:hypothetical protein n=1 Tax=Streptomyces sp. NBC_00572 TaxID=2903664 RepID=UPI00225B2625|nr:hypothetical protein [Streptomyces sp. NBC_00572]MCX4986300.1 hypothetical protein [Streptomyces sp. NBC_00572]
MSVPVPEYVPDFRPTHVVPRAGLDAWEAPDPGLPTTPLDAFLPVRLEERAGDWGRVLCSNGWTAWVDARLLVTVPDDPPAAGRPLTRTADPRPLIARAEDALGRYRRAAEALGAGRLDGENFRLRTRGLRVGMVVDGESVWLYDAEHERWVYCDGVGLSTYAASASPSVAAPAADAVKPEEPAGERGAVPTPVHEPTQVVLQGDPPLAAGPTPTQVVPQVAPGTEAEPPTEVVPQVDPVAEAEPPTELLPQVDPAAGPPPTQVVPQVDPAAAAGPPPTQVTKRPPPGTAGEG